MPSLQASPERDQLRRFRAVTVEEAVEAARRELGPDAEILEANRIRRGGVGGFFATDLGVEVVAAPAGVTTSTSELGGEPDVARPVLDGVATDQPSGGVTPLASGRRGRFAGAESESGTESGAATGASRSDDHLTALLAAVDRSEASEPAPRAGFESDHEAAASFARHLASAVSVVDDAVVAEALADGPTDAPTGVPPVITAAEAGRDEVSISPAPTAAVRSVPVATGGHATVAGDHLDALVLPRGGREQRSGRAGVRRGDAPESASIVDVVSEALAARRAELAEGRPGSTTSQPLGDPVPPRNPARRGLARPATPLDHDVDASRARADGGDAPTAPSSSTRGRVAPDAGGPGGIDLVTPPWTERPEVSQPSRGAVDGHVQNPTNDPNSDPGPDPAGDASEGSDDVRDPDPAESAAGAAEASASAVRAATTAARKAATKQAAAKRTAAKRTAATTSSTTTSRSRTRSSTAKTSTTAKKSTTAKSSAAGTRRSAARAASSGVAEVELAADAIGRLLERVAVLDVPAGARVEDLQTLQVAVTAGDGTKIEMSATLGGER